jgi:hypothetical protein
LARTSSRRRQILSGLAWRNDRRLIENAKPENYSCGARALKLPRLEVSQFLFLRLRFVPRKARGPALQNRIVAKRGFGSPNYEKSRARAAQRAGNAAARAKMGDAFPRWKAGDERARAAGRKGGVTSAARRRAALEKERDAEAGRLELAVGDPLALGRDEKIRA